MRRLTRISAAALIAAAGLSLAACGSGETTTDEDTAVTDLDPGEGDGTIDDTTVIDATIGAEEEMGMDGGMPADSAEPDRPASARTPTPAAQEPVAEEDGDGDAEGGEPAE